MTSSEWDELADKIAELHSRVAEVMRNEHRETDCECSVCMCFGHLSEAQGYAIDKRNTEAIREGQLLYERGRR